MLCELYIQDFNSVSIVQTLLRYLPGINLVQINIKTGHEC
jgi:hypothetical protein